MIMGKNLTMKDTVRQMKNSIETCTTAVENPFSPNLIVAEATEKTLKDEKCEPEIALAWAVSAKYAFQNHLGYSQNELVFGFNINTPLALTDQLLSLEAATTSEIVRTNLNALHAMRKSFIEAEACEKIRWALRSNVRTYAEKEFVMSDTVYYRRQNWKGWHGSAKVLCKEDQCILIRHGRAFYRMHPYHSMKANKVSDQEHVVWTHLNKNKLKRWLMQRKEK